MATKFGYVERNIENDVNWGEVGKGFADMLVAEREERQAKKDLLDDAMIKTQDALKEAPLGYNTDFNDRIIGLADNASSYLLAANKDLKAGKLTPAEYMRKVQRMNSSADQIFNLSNNYNKLYEEHLNRLDDGVSGKVEQAIFEKIDNMTNFNENDFFIDSTGAIVAAPLVKGKDGITTIDPNRAMSAQAMFNLAQNFVNKVDVEAEAKKSADRLATFITSTATGPDYRNKGRTEVITDIRQRGDYLELKKSLIDGILSSDLSTSSVLADYIGGYDVVTKKGELSKDPAEREKQVYIDISNGKEGRAELTESQKKIAEERIGLVLEGMIDSKTMVSETAKKEYSASDKARYRSGKVKEEIAGYWNQLGWGNAEQKKRAVELIIANKAVLEGGVIGLKPNDTFTELEVIFKDSDKNRTIDLTQSWSPMDWANEGSDIHGESDKNKAVSAGGGWGKTRQYQYLDAEGKPLFEDVKSLRKGAQDTGPSPLERYGNYLKQKITTESSSEDITDALAGTGFEMIGKKLYKGGKPVSNRIYDFDNKSDINALISNVATVDAAESFVVSRKILPTTGTGAGAGDDLFKE